MTVDDETDALLTAEIIDEEQNQQDEKRVYSYNEAVELLGVGWFHAKLVLICGWANATDAVELMCVSLAMPSVQCELGLTSAELGVISAVVFVGMMIGGYTWGSLGDVYGRKPVVIVALLINAVFGFFSAFSKTLWTFLLFRFISGLGVGGSVPVIWSYFIEWQPPKIRGMMLSFIATFWMVGQLIVCGIAWILIPMQDVYLDLSGFKFSQWRIFLAVSTFICASSAVLFLLLPESPKYLLLKGKADKALQILRTAHRENASSQGHYPVRQLEKIQLTNEGQYRRFGTVSGWSRIKRDVSGLLQKTAELSRKPWLRKTSIIVTINFVLAFGYYGLIQWFPELFTKSRSLGHGGQICSSPVTNSSVNSTSSVSPCANVGDPTVFRDNFIISLSTLPGNLITIFLMDVIGRKIIFVSGIVLGAVSAFLIYVVSTSVQVLVMSCIFGGVSVLYWNCLDAFMTELFPTHLRSTSMGIGLAFARLGAIIGNLTFGLLVETHCAIPLVLVAVLLGIGGLFSLLLPDLTRQQID